MQDNCLLGNELWAVVQTTRFAGPLQTIEYLDTMGLTAVQFTCIHTYQEHRNDDTNQGNERK